jgi:hypothetical protein
MAAEFTDNLIEFLEDKAKEFNPNFATSEGTAIRDLFVKPFSVIFQPIVDEILKVRANLSLADAASLEDADLDRLAANFFVTRKAGSKSIGTVRLFFSEPVDEFVSQGTIFLAANGVRFVASADVTITSSGLRLNTFGDLFFKDIPSEAELAGGSGNVAANLISDLLVGSDKIVDVSNPSPFTGGSDVETNEQLLDRLSIAITFRNLINKPGAKLILLENFARLMDVFVVGFADKHTILDEFIGVGDGVTLDYRLSETEDVIGTTVDVSIDVVDEVALAGAPPTYLGVATPGFKQLTFFPYDFESLELRYGASFLLGTPLVVDTDYVGGPQVSVADELVAVGPFAPGPNILAPVDFFPIDASPAIEVRAGASILLGALLLPTHYTVNLATGVISLTALGTAFVNLQVPPDVHAKYSATSLLTGAFALRPSGATAIGGAQLHAKYAAGVLDDTLVTGDFDGSVTFTVVPSAGAIITATFSYYLMRRDRMSGTNLVLGDDTFGTQTNVHIGGKVDYYLKFLGLEEEEVRINGVKATNFLFEQTTNDPAPTLTQQYVDVSPLPILPRVLSPFDDAVIERVIIEKVDPGTNLPSGIFLAEGVAVTDELVATGPVVAGVFQLDNFPINAGTLQLHAGTIAGPLLVDPVDYTVNLATGQVTLTAAGAIVVNAAIPPDIHALYSTGDYALEIMPNKLNVNMSTRQRLRVIINNPLFVGVDVFLRYYSHPDFEVVQAFVDDEANRIVCADLLVRAPMPVFVDLTVNYSRLQGGPDPDTVSSGVSNFINNLKVGKCLSVFDLAKALNDIGVQFMQLPLTIDALRVNLDFSTVRILTDNKVEIPPNFQFVSRTIVVNEVALSGCDAI